MILKLNREFFFKKFCLFSIETHFLWDRGSIYILVVPLKRRVRAICSGGSKASNTKEPT
jgi:hypothetical protein